jgi:GxxExxY protein
MSGAFGKSSGNGEPKMSKATEHTEHAESPRAQIALLHEDLTGVIRQTAFETHQYFGSGFLEKVYTNALAHRLRKKGLKVQPKQEHLVCDEDGTVVGEYESDLIVDDCVLIEVKAAKAIIGDHVAQTLNYLKVTGIPVGLLINFGKTRLEVRRFLGPSVSSVCSVAPLPPS